MRTQALATLGILAVSASAQEGWWMGEHQRRLLPRPRRSPGALATRAAGDYTELQFHSSPITSWLSCARGVQGHEASTERWGLV